MITVHVVLPGCNFLFQLTILTDQLHPYQPPKLIYFCRLKYYIAALVNIQQEYLRHLVRLAMWMGKDVDILNT